MLWAAAAPAELLMELSWLVVLCAGRPPPPAPAAGRLWRRMKAAITLPAAPALDAGTNFAGCARQISRRFDVGIIGAAARGTSAHASSAWHAEYPCCAASMLPPASTGDQALRLIPLRRPCQQPLAPAQHLPAGLHRPCQGLHLLCEQHTTSLPGMQSRASEVAVAGQLVQSWCAWVVWPLFWPFSGS